MSYKIQDLNFQYQGKKRSPSRAKASIFNADIGDLKLNLCDMVN